MPPSPPRYEPGAGVGALREWWGWESSSLLEQAWLFPSYLWSHTLDGLKRRPIVQLGLFIEPNGTETSAAFGTPASFKQLPCFAQRITSFFRPKVTANYSFTIWANDNTYGRLFLNKNGADADGAELVAASGCMCEKPSTNPLSRSFPKLARSSGVVVEDLGT